MKKEYESPVMSTLRICGDEALLGTSLAVGGTVNSSEDIGFVKEERRENYDVWREDWSE